MPVTRLVSVANGLSAIAPLLWGHFGAEEIKTLQLVSDPAVKFLELTGNDQLGSALFGRKGDYGSYEGYCIANGTCRGTVSRFMGL